MHTVIEVQEIADLDRSVSKAFIGLVIIIIIIIVNVPSEKLYLWYLLNVIWIRVLQKTLRK